MNKQNEDESALAVAAGYVPVLDACCGSCIYPTMSHEPAAKGAASAREEIPDKGPVGLVALWRVVSWGRWYVSIPTDWEDWPDDNPKDSFRRYETRCVSIQRDKPSDWEPRRPSS